MQIRRAGEELRRLAEAPRLVWLRDGRGDELIAEGGTRASVVSIPTLALMGALPATPLGEQMSRTLGQDLSFALEPTARCGRLSPACARSGWPGSPARCRRGALSGARSGRPVAAGPRRSRGAWPCADRAAERFVLLASQRLREHLKVSDYARLLDVSRDRLGSAVQRATGLSPQTYLHNALMREASELLASTGIPVAASPFVSASRTRPISPALHPASQTKPLAVPPCGQGAARRRRSILRRLAVKLQFVRLCGPARLLCRALEQHKKLGRAG